jgi:hypothetical protein
VIFIVPLERGGHPSAPALWSGVREGTDTVPTKAASQKTWQLSHGTMICSVLDIFTLQHDGKDDNFMANVLLIKINMTLFIDI